VGLVFEKKVKGSATHAIVIGVGSYAHLPGGSSKDVYPNHEGLGQLTSPPFSAREITNWLLTKYHNESAPLSSVNLFLSDPASDEYKVPGSGEVKKVDRAMKSPVKKGILDWFKKGNKNKDDLMFFYFCGHGVTGGIRTILLLEDFGKEETAPFENSIKFDDGLWLGMDKCAARKQCYFIDACRSGSYALAQAYGDPGDPIIWGDKIVRTRNSPRYYSAVLGEGAYSRPGAPSFFTEALIRALNGAGSNDLDGPWQVTADWLAIGINQVMKTIFKEQKCEAQVTDLLLHQIGDKPVVPTVVSCSPQDANGIARLSYRRVGSNEEIPREKTETGEWVVNVEVGNYWFSAKFDDGGYNSNAVETEIRPPIKQVPIEVSK
jgi:Caspase domain